MHPFYYKSYITDLLFSTDTGGGFDLACEDFGNIFDNSFPPCVFSVVLLKWRLARANSTL